MPKLPADDCSGTTVRLATLILKTNLRGGEGRGPKTKRASSTTPAFPVPRLPGLQACPDRSSTISRLLPESTRRRPPEGGYRLYA